MPVIPIGEFAPDRPSLNEAQSLALNVIPRPNSYSPLPSFMPYSLDALNSRARGAGAFRSTGNIIGHYAGTTDRLYRLNGGTNWINASGATYITPEDNNWNFVQFGPLTICVNGVDVAQKITTGAVGNFAPLLGTPPIARYIAVVRDFVFMGNLQNAPQTVRWSGINNAESWTIGLDQADDQLIPDGGWVQGIVGGEFALVFNEFSINRFTYVGGGLIFQRDQITNSIGATIPGSIAGYLDRAFFVHRTGFYQVVGGSTLQPVGAERVNNYFWSTIDQNYLFRVTSCIDPERNLYIISFPNLSATSGTPNQFLIYNWITDKWSIAMPGNHEIIYQGLTANQLSLEQLSAIYPNIETVPYSFDSSIWTGVGRLAVHSFNTNHFGQALLGQNLPASIDMVERQLDDGTRTFARSLRPLVDGTAQDITLNVFARNKLNESAIMSVPHAIDVNGKFSFRSNSRFHRFRININDSDWTHFQGIDELAGSRGGTR